MQSIASLMSVNNTVEADVAHLDDFEVDDITDTAELMDITQQLDMLTNSLTGSTSTPMSGLLNALSFSMNSISLKHFN